MNGYMHSEATDQNAKNSQDLIYSIRRADLTTFLTSVLNAIHVCMQYPIHMQEELWNL